MTREHDRPDSRNQSRRHQIPADGKNLHQREDGADREVHDERNRARTLHSTIVDCGLWIVDNAGPEAARGWSILTRPAPRAIPGA
jgi:hypothetical protein